MLGHRPAAVCSTSQSGTNGVDRAAWRSVGAVRLRCGFAVEHTAFGGRLAEQRRVEQCCGIVAEQDLAALGRPLAVDGGAHTGPDHEQLSVARVDEVEVEDAAVDALRDTELHALHEGVDQVRSIRVTHPETRRGGPGGVFVTGEQHEQGVATELEDVAAEVVDDLDHPAEALVEQDGEFLGALAAVRRRAARTVR